MKKKTFTVNYFFKLEIFLHSFEQVDTIHKILNMKWMMCVADCQLTVKDEWAVKVHCPGVG